MEKIEKIWLTDDAVWIRTADGREACEKFADYPRLIHLSFFGVNIIILVIYWSAVSYTNDIKSFNIIASLEVKQLVLLSLVAFRRL